MRASPYDLGDLGYDSVPIETPEGKAAYVGNVGPPCGPTTCANASWPSSTPPPLPRNQEQLADSGPDPALVGGAPESAVRSGRTSRR